MSTRSTVPVMVAALLCSVAPARGQALPDGDGKETVAALCGSCHDIDLGVPVPPDQVPTVTESLTKNFPVKLVAMPAPKSRPYGMAVNSTGLVFVVEFGANRIASIDPRTMQIREFSPPDAGARPRRLAITGDDIVWYSDFARGYLGRLDPATGQVREWPSPGGPSSEPYGMAVAQAAVFCAQIPTLRSNAWPWSTKPRA